jgi:hypothetical protein
LSIIAASVELNWFDCFGMLPSFGPSFTVFMFRRPHYALATGCLPWSAHLRFIALPWIERGLQVQRALTAERET